MTSSPLAAHKGSQTVPVTAGIESLESYQRKRLISCSPPYLREMCYNARKRDAFYHGYGQNAEQGSLAWQP